MISISPEAKVLTVHCSKCGKGIILGIGYTALEMTQERAFGILLNIGWQIAPKMKCASCQCNMTFWEMQKARKLWGEWEDGTTNIKEFVAFSETMAKQYGNSARKFFMSLGGRKVKL